jgi:large conductance mechanosensitive channel
MGFWADFKTFVAKGNVLDMAVGIIIGIAFGAVITSAVNDVLMPPIGLALGGADLTDSYIVLEGADMNGTEVTEFASLQEAKDAGAVTLRWGLLVNAVINLLIIAILLFLLVRTVARLKKKEEKKEEATTKQCPHCDTAISLKAARCPNCTSKL